MFSKITPPIFDCKSFFSSIGSKKSFFLHKRTCLFDEFSIQNTPLPAFKLAIKRMFVRKIYYSKPHKGVHGYSAAPKGRVEMVGLSKDPKY